MKIDQILLFGAISLWAIIKAGHLYVRDGQRTIFYELPAPMTGLEEDVPIHMIERQLRDRGYQLDFLNHLNFDQVTNVMDLMRFPRTFFEESFNVEQLVQVVMNDNLREVVKNTFLHKSGSGIKDRGLMKTKLKIIHGKLALLTPQNLGARHEAVIGRIPSSLYFYLEPITALLARTGKRSCKALKNLFHITAQTIAKLVLNAGTALLATIKAIKSTGLTPYRIFQIADRFLDLLIAYPIIGDLVPRVYLLFEALEKLTTFGITGIETLRRFGQTINGPHDAVAAQPLSTEASAKTLVPTSKPRISLVFEVKETRRDRIKAVATKSKANAKTIIKKPKNPVFFHA